MIIRWRSKDGTFRTELEPASDVSLLVSKIIDSAVEPDPASICISQQPRGGEVPVLTLAGKSLKQLGLSHGDLLFVSYKTQTHENVQSDSQPNGVQIPNPVAHSTIVEESVDAYWRRQDGKIIRSRDARFCTHGSNAMCEYCSPLEPFDVAHHAQHSIKHLSFHAYLRKISPAANRSSVASSGPPPLSPLSYKVKVPCPTGAHAPWPANLCTACQPSAITLQSQSFRMVDHLEFASDTIIDRFLQAWRATGVQRFGWLVGHYEPYPEVPMGIKAVVEAIHEPPQEGEIDGLSLGLPWEDEARIRHLASLASTPLSIVGQIYTDLTADEEDRTKVIYKRHAQSFYLSSLEAIFAAKMQLRNPTLTPYSPTGQFSSRFVTAVLSGTESGGIDVAAYQVSEQACAMVDADMIEASVEPGIVRVKEDSRNVEDARYIPDVFFRYKNEYRRDVQKSAKPAFPVEYLLINVTHGFPNKPEPMFRATDFPIENRPGLEHSDMSIIFKGLSASGGFDVNPHPDRLFRWLSDWHLVSFLTSSGIFAPDDLKLIMSTATASDKDVSTAMNQLLSSGGWATLITIGRESAAPADSRNRAINAVGDDSIPPEVLEAISRDEHSPLEAGLDVRICPHCTFENIHGGGDCEVCGLPLQ